MAGNTTGGMKAVTLFSSIGICEYYLKDIGINVVLSNEINPTRANTHIRLYPDVEMVCGDITEEKIQREIIEKCQGQDIRLLIATPPCQGLSTAGINKTEASIRNDMRNYLILSAFFIFDALKCDYFLIENVPRFQKMVFPWKGEYVQLDKLLEEKYGNEYHVDVRVFNAAMHGVPQTRYRVVYRLWKKGLEWREPAEETPISLRQAIGDLPSLEPGMDSGLVNHYARQHSENHIECMRYTATGKSAFDNEKFYPKRLDGERIRGFKNTYKRMRWEEPAPTITMRNEIISSQENVHPGRPLGDGAYSDARVLTLRELLIVSSLPAEMPVPELLTETAFRQLIGEGIPPLLLKKIMEGIRERNER